MEEVKDSVESTETPLDDELNDIKNQIVERSKELEAFNALKTANAGDMVQALQNKEIMDVIATDAETKEELNKNAKNIVKTQTDTIKTKVDSDNQKAKFDSNKDACEVYGVSESCPLWQQRLMKLGASFWFFIYFIIATVTIAPIGIFSRKLSNIFKKGWIAILVGVLFYLFITVGIPLLTTLVR